MVPLSKFNAIRYSKPRLYNFDKPLTNIYGFDSEAYRDGWTFMYCTSEGDCFTSATLIHDLFDKYPGANFVVWNLKYESGAILKCFPLKTIKELQLHHKATVTLNEITYEITYIPHKRLRIKEKRFHGKSVRFWDMSPFYGRTKLATAAETYLKETKDDVNPELFTYEYVEKNFDTIFKYCVQDSLLTKKLAILWIDKFQQTGIPVTSLYSEASISFTYISKKTDIVSPHEFWDNSKKLVQLAFESYEGGKFEITSRGKFTGYEYDISSAYPYEIANLVDTRNARVVHSKKYVPEAVYGFLRVRIKLSNPDVHLPCGIFKKLRIYPMGEYYLTITKQEYDYMTRELDVRGLTVDIIEGEWLVVNRFRYPYKAVMQELYELKTKWKKIDRLRSNNYKIVMNGFYGKLAQCLLQEDGTYQAGIGWNPLYASIITANTRIAVTRLQNLLGDACYAVHTDSVICKDTIPNRFLGTGLGKFELVEKGDGILVACGIYEINGQCALKGFKKNSIRSILADNPGKKKITITVKKHCESWLIAMAQNHDVSQINLFSDIPKVLTLNCDSKRDWGMDVDSNFLLNDFQNSTPLVEHQISAPSFWK